MPVAETVIDIIFYPVLSIIFPRTVHDFVGIFSGVFDFDANLIPPRRAQAPAPPPRRFPVTVCQGAPPAHAI